MTEPHQPLGTNELIEGHTLKRYDGELNHLHYLVLDMGVLVLNQVRQALAAFKSRDLASALKVVSGDSDVDRLELAADDEIVKLIARRCPVGRDLRMVMAVSKGVSDLERIGDEAAKIAGLVIQIFGNENSDPNGQLVRGVNGMGVMAVASLQSAVELFDVWREDKARTVIEQHRLIEEEFRSDLRRLMTYVLEDVRNIGMAISLVLVIKSLERIAHHAQNLAEYATFQVKGEDIRHQNP